MLAKTRLQILVLPERPQHESYAFGVGTREQQYSVADHAVTQQRRRVIEENQVEPIARNLAAERPGQTPDRVLDRRRTRHMLVVEQHRNVDVALAARGAARPASVQPSEAHRGIVAQAAGETVAKTGRVSFVGELGHFHPSLGRLVTPVREPEEPRISACRLGRKIEAGGRFGLGHPVDDARRCG